MSEPLVSWLAPHWRRFLETLDGDRASHAVLVAGESGLGKRGLAERMVARLLCRAPVPSGEACGACQACVWRVAGTHPDLFHVMPEEDSEVIKVDQVRDLIARLTLTGQIGGRRVAMLDPADSMNVAAQNALLKTLEEPASGVHLILIADAPARLLATIRSRCQIVSVTAPSAAQTHVWLQASNSSRLPDDMRDLAAGHPGRILSLAQQSGQTRVKIVADDLIKLRSEEETPLAVAQRWSSEPNAHVEDAMAWLRLWSWRLVEAPVSAKAIPFVDHAILSDSYARALRLRELLRTPLKPGWLLHEWLSAWQSASR